MKPSLHPTSVISSTDYQLEINFRSNEHFRIDHFCPLCCDGFLLQFFLRVTPLMKQSTCYCYTCRHREFSHLLHQKWFQFHTLLLFHEWREDGAGTVHWLHGGICGNTGGTSARCGEEREPCHKSLDLLHSVPHLRPLALGSDREDEVVNSSDWNEGFSECGWTQTSRQGGGVQTWGNLRQWRCCSLVWKTLLWEGGLEDPVTPATINR